MRQLSSRRWALYSWVGGRVIAESNGKRIRMKAVGRFPTVLVRTDAAKRGRRYRQHKESMRLCGVRPSASTDGR
jgi:hypothetical protein